MLRLAESPPLIPALIKGRPLYPIQKAENRGLSFDGPSVRFDETKIPSLLHYSTEKFFHRISSLEFAFRSSSSKSFRWLKVIIWKHRKNSITVISSFRNQDVAGWFALQSEWRLIRAHLCASLICIWEIYMKKRRKSGWHAFINVLFDFCSPSIDWEGWRVMYGPCCLSHPDENLLWKSMDNFLSSNETKRDESEGEILRKARSLGERCSYFSLYLFS